MKTFSTSVVSQVAEEVTGSSVGNLTLTPWANGAGFTLSVTGPHLSIRAFGELSWEDWDALVLLVQRAKLGAEDADI